MSLKVLFCTSEAVPYAKTGGLADVAGALPPALAKLGHDVRLALPKYREVDSAKIGSSPVGKPFDVRVGGSSFRVQVESSDAIEGIHTYLVDCPELFDRDGLYGHPDDHVRFALFCRALLQFVAEGDWCPDVIHGNDWQAALLPVLLKTEYARHPDLSRIGTLHTIHNLAYQGAFDKSVLEEVGLDSSLFTVDKLEFYGQVNFLKGGLVFADLLNTVSKKYAEEIQTDEFGERLEGVLGTRREDLYGILNGLDYEHWNPASDSYLESQFDAENLAGKAACKAQLQRRFELPERPDAPVLGLVSRLAAQKGLNLLAEALPYLLRLDVQFVLLGTGEQYYHDLLAGLAAEYPDKMGLALTFDNALAHQIYAGSDMFLMPSHYEPCGLGQMISLRYGTIPVVRSTGGLADTIDEFNPETGEGNGFSFEDFSAVALLGAITRGLFLIRNTPAWSQLVHNAMAADFSWERSAGQYADLYERAVARRRS
ncbi:MAG: glycogen synthase GlgA [Armatimonadetes bacterium]|nr:glycogen synthase GlgA [Armatimonadota bacterium]